MEEYARESAPEPAPFREPRETAPEPAPFREPTESAPEPRSVPGATESAPEPAPFREPTESAPEPAPFREPTESAPEPAPFREPTESAPEPAPFREPTESAPEPAPFREPTESAPEPLRSGSRQSRSRARLRSGSRQSPPLSPLQSPLQSRAPEPAPEPALQSPLRSGSQQSRSRAAPFREPTQSGSIREPTESAHKACEGRRRCLHTVLLLLPAPPWHPCLPLSPGPLPLHGPGPPIPPPYSNPALSFPFVGPFWETSGSRSFKGGSVRSPGRRPCLSPPEGTTLPSSWDSSLHSTHLCTHSSLHSTHLCTYSSLSAVPNVWDYYAPQPPPLCLPRLLLPALTCTWLYFTVCNLTDYVRFRALGTPALRCHLGCPVLDYCFVFACWLLILLLK